MATAAVSGGIPKRFVLVGMCFLATTLCYIDRVNISVAVIPMAEEYGWSATTKGIVLSSFFIGYLLAMTPGGWASNRFGGRIMLGWALLLWSLFTYLTPAAAALSFGALIAARIFMGMGEAVNFPAVVALFARWLPPHERTRAQTINFAGIPAGTVLGLVVSGALVEHYGWPAAFHVFGGVGLAYAALWFLIVRASPDTHPTISAAERAHLAPIAAEHADVPPVPWRRIMAARPVQALIVNHFCTTWSLYLMLTWLPSYFRDVQKLDIANSGLFSAAPWLTAFVVGPIVGQVCDRLLARGASLTAVRKWTQSIAMLGSAAGLLLAAQATHPDTALIILCATMALHSFANSGFGSNHLDIAPRYAPTLYGISNTFATIPGIVGVAATGWLLDLTGSYGATFAVAAGINVVGAIVWLAWATGEKVID
jgi:ACS family sodium-dependent inorganic phosphate cotransporter